MMKKNNLVDKQKLEEEKEKEVTLNIREVEIKYLINDKLLTSLSSLMKKNS